MFDFIKRAAERKAASIVLGDIQDSLKREESKLSQEKLDMGVYLKGALAALAAGFVGAVGSNLTDFRTDKASLVKMAVAGVAGALSGLVLYLKQSPLPAK